MQIEFKTRNPRQIDAAKAWIDSTIEEILYGGAKGGGKSYLGASLIFGDALIYPDTHYFIARKELIDLRKHTVPTIYEVFSNWKLDTKKYFTYNGQDNFFQLHNGSRVYLIACSDVPSDPLFERFGSMQMTRGWIEEGGEVAEAAKSNLWLSIGRWKNETYGLKKKMLITANPKKGWMKRDFIDPWKQDLLPPSRVFIQAFPTDNPYLPKDYVESLRNEKDVVRRQRLWEGNWDYDESADSLISFDALTDSFSNIVDSDGKKYMTVDVARLGRDRTVFAYWNGLELYKVDTYEKKGTDITEQNIKDKAASERIPYSNILIDEDGIGGGVVDHLFGVKGFTANSSVIPTLKQIRERQLKVQHNFINTPVYANLKAQCGWKLAELINERKIAFRVPEHRDEIIEELTSILRDHAVDGETKKRLRKKEEVKQELGKSPDIADTILMRAYFELVKDSTGESDTAGKRILEEQSVILRQNKNNMSRNSAR